ncbi:MAG: hypothetical protein ACLR1P_09290 [Oscillospiraceae bacterium]
MSFLNDVLNIFIKYYPQLLTGVGNTVLIALTSTVAGLALGLLTGVVRTAPMSRTPSCARCTSCSMRSLQSMSRSSAERR